MITLAHTVLVGLSSANPDFTLFQRVMRFNEASPAAVVGLGIAILVLLLVVVSLELWRQRRELKDRINQQWRVFEGLAGARGLDASDIDFLKELHAGMESLHSPDVLIRIPAVYDRALEAWIGDRTIAPEQWQKLSRIRRQLGFKGLTGETSLSHTRQMTDGQIIRLAPESGEEWFTARVVNNNEDCIEVMPDTHIAWSPGSEIRLAFSRQGDGEYKSHVRLIRRDAESPALILGHSAKLSRQQLRMWVRVPVYLEGKMRELTDSEGTPMEPREFDVHLLDLSGGGTMASTPVELPVDARGLLDFRLGETMIEGIRFILLRNGKPAKDGGHTCHLCWDGIEISAQERIMRFVFERQRLGGTAR